jgi:hypothetical protein
VKRIVISVVGGIADFEENKYNLNVRIIDFDSDGKPDEDIETELTEDEMKVYDAVVYVTGGIAEVVYEADGIEVEINDYD